MDINNENIWEELEVSEWWQEYFRDLYGNNDILSRSMVANCITVKSLRKKGI